MAMFVAQETGPLHRVSRFERALAGAEANVAVALARLDHRVGWLGRVGDDPFGRYALEQLRAARVDVGEVSVDVEASTGFQLKSMARGGDPEVRYFRRGSAGSRLAVSSSTDAALGSARHLHLTGIPLALSATMRGIAWRAMDVAHRENSTVSFDPNLRPALWPDQRTMLREVDAMATRADWVLPGLAEGRLLTGRDSARGIADYYLARGVRAVAVKLGADGAHLFTADGDWALPAFSVAVVDTVGAGDGFAAGMISAALDGLPWADRLRRAVAVGALATKASGDMDGMPSRRALTDFLAANVASQPPVDDSAVRTEGRREIKT
jgi:sugar/nucleoside kinase (ribokinase family)